MKQKQLLVDYILNYLEQAIILHKTGSNKCYLKSMVACAVSFPDINCFYLNSLQFLSKDKEQNVVYLSDLDSK